MWFHLLFVMHWRRQANLLQPEDVCTCQNQNYVQNWFLVKPWPQFIARNCCCGQLSCGYVYNLHQYVFWMSSVINTAAVSSCPCLQCPTLLGISDLMVTIKSQLYTRNAGNLYTVRGYFKIAGVAFYEPFSQYIWPNIELSNCKSQVLNFNCWSDLCKY